MENAAKSIESLDSVDEEPANLQGKKLKSILKKRTFSPDIHCVHCQKLQKEVNVIRRSLDDICLNLSTQHKVISRDFEERIRHVYDDVISDINTVRNRVNYVGDEFAPSLKYRIWRPLTPFRKEILRQVYEIRQPAKFTSSKSVDFADNNHYEGSEKPARYVPVHHRLGESVGNIYSSTSSVGSMGSSRSLVPGYGCCFSGDGKTVPHHSHPMWHVMERSESIGTSRSDSAGSMLDTSAVLNTSRDTCLCGDVTDDWRAKVAPHMWGGWSVPGLDSESLEAQKQRHKRLSEIRQEVLDVHNQYRKQYGVPNLTLKPDLATSAQKWAENLARRGYAQYSNIPENVSLEIYIHGKRKTGVNEQVHVLMISTFKTMNLQSVMHRRVWYIGVHETFFIEDVDDVGENILVVDIEEELTGRQIVDTWYREKRLYNFALHRWQRGTCNFTQMIWRSSQFAGVGIAKFPHHNTCIVVVQYQPPGNINTPEQYRFNVSRPINLESGSPVSKRKSTPVRAQTLSRYSLPRTPMMGQAVDLSFDSGRFTNGSFDTTLDESTGTTESSPRITPTSPRVFPVNPTNRHFTKSNMSFDTTLTESSFESPTNDNHFIEATLSRSQENISYVQSYPKYPKAPRSVSLKRKNKTVATLVQRSLSVSTVTLDKPDESYFCILEKGPIKINRTLSCNVGSDKRRGNRRESDSSQDSNGHPTIHGQLLFSSGWTNVGRPQSRPMIEEIVERKQENKQEATRSVTHAKVNGITPSNRTTTQQTKQPTPIPVNKGSNSNETCDPPKQVANTSRSITPFVPYAKPYASAIQKYTKTHADKPAKDPFAKEIDVKPKSLNANKFDELVSRMRSKYLGQKQSNAHHNNTDAGMNGVVVNTIPTSESKPIRKSNTDVAGKVLNEKLPETNHDIHTIIKDIKKERNVVRTGKVDGSSSGSIRTGAEKHNSSLDDSTDNVVFTYSMQKMKTSEQSGVKNGSSQKKDTVCGPTAGQPGCQKQEHNLSKSNRNYTPPCSQLNLDKRTHLKDDRSTKLKDGQITKLNDDECKEVKEDRRNNTKDGTRSNDDDEKGTKQKDDERTKRIAPSEKKTTVPPVEMKDQSCQTYFKELTIHRQAFSVGNFKSGSKITRTGKSRTNNCDLPDNNSRTNITSVCRNESVMSEELDRGTFMKPNVSQADTKARETPDLPTLKKYKLRSSSKGRRSQSSSMNTQRITMADVIYNEPENAVKETESVKLYVKELIDTAIAKKENLESDKAQDKTDHSTKPREDGDNRAKKTKTPAVISADERRPKMYNVGSKPLAEFKPATQAKEHKRRNLKGNTNLPSSYEETGCQNDNNSISSFGSQDFDCPRGLELNDSSPNANTVSRTSDTASTRETTLSKSDKTKPSSKSGDTNYKPDDKSTGFNSGNPDDIIPEIEREITHKKKSGDHGIDRGNDAMDTDTHSSETFYFRIPKGSHSEKSKEGFAFGRLQGRDTPVPDDDNVRQHTMEIATGNSATYRELSFDDDDSLDRILDLLGDGIETHKNKQFSRQVITEPTYKRDVDFN